MDGATTCGANSRRRRDFFRKILPRGGNYLLDALTGGPKMQPGGSIA
jgi:hypothetical protein